VSHEKPSGFERKMERRFDLASEYGSLRDEAQLPIVPLLIRLPHRAVKPLLPDGDRGVSEDQSVPLGTAYKSRPSGRRRAGAANSFRNARMRSLRASLFFRVRWNRALSPLSADMVNQA
jgi:hypothetical protein